MLKHDYLTDSIALLNDINAEINMILSNKTNEKLVKASNRLGFINVVLAAVGIVVAIVMATKPNVDIFKQKPAASVIENLCMHFTQQTHPFK